MSSLFSHLFIPVAILIMFSDRLKIDPKKIIMLSFFGILPDIDIFIILHRAFFHNIFILIIPLLIFFFIKDVNISGIICFYLASHLILDIFNGGIFLLYPISDNVFFFHTEIMFKDSVMVPLLNYGISKNIMSNTGEPMISSENIGVMILLIITMLTLIMKGKYR